MQSCIFFVQLVRIVWEEIILNIGSGRLVILLGIVHLGFAQVTVPSLYGSNTEGTVSIITPQHQSVNLPCTIIELLQSYLPYMIMKRHWG